MKELPAMGDIACQKYVSDIEHPVLFLMPFDETRDILCAKRQKVENCLGQEFPLHFHLRLVAPEEMGLSNSADYVPTLKIACFVMNTSEINRVYSCLKSALYAPAREKKTKVERFRLETHGYLHPKFNSKSRSG